jgi:hypothetical protein
LEEEVSQIADFIALQNMPKQINSLQSQALGQTNSFFFLPRFVFLDRILIHETEGKKTPALSYIEQ